MIREILLLAVLAHLATARMPKSPQEKALLRERYPQIAEASPCVRAFNEYWTNLIVYP